MDHLIIDNKDFSIGDYVKREYTRKSCNNGIITNILPGIDGDAPCLEILLDDGQLHIDYYYCFELDIQRKRDEKLNKLYE